MIQDDTLSVSETIAEFQESDDTVPEFDMLDEDFPVPENASSLDVAAMKLAILSGADPGELPPPAAGQPQTGDTSSDAFEPGGLSAELKQMREAYTAEQQRARVPLDLVAHSSR